ncbi:MAG: FISUMP domain-containing protein [Cytophagales bacterium]|nr:FISUMP domain-containing protein [Cytophagales bacterium]
MKAFSRTGFALLLLLCGCQYFSIFKTVSLDIKTSIPNIKCLVNIDGKNVGITPLKVSVIPGKTHLKVSSMDDAYICNFDQEFKFPSKLEQEIVVDCKAKATVSVNLELDDKDAIVIINEDTVKDWSSYLSKMAPDTYKIQVIGSFGYGNFDQDYVFNPFDTTTIRLKLALDTAVWKAENVAFEAIRIGDQWWTANNLAKIGENNTCYEEDDKNCETYGALYNWYEAKEVADQIDGWRLPSDADWKKLEETLGMDTRTTDSLDWRGNPIGRSLKTDGQSGFKGLYGGFLHFDGDEYAFLEESGYYWTATDTSMKQTDLAALRFIQKKEGRLYRNYAYKTYGFSVRLVKDADATLPN